MELSRHETRCSRRRPPRSAATRPRHRRRRGARLAAAVGLLALAGSALYAPTAATAATPRPRQPPRPAARRRDRRLDRRPGRHARFEVLTPTLIRMEYAGDNQFQDAATFNAVNRSFPRSPSRRRSRTATARSPPVGHPALQGGQRAVHRREHLGHSRRHQRHRGAGVPVLLRLRHRVPGRERPAQRRRGGRLRPRELHRFRLRRRLHQVHRRLSHAGRVRGPVGRDLPARRAVRERHRRRRQERHPHPVDHGQRRARPDADPARHRLVGHLVHRVGAGHARRRLDTDRHRAERRPTAATSTWTASPSPRPAPPTPRPAPPARCSPPPTAPARPTLLGGWVQLAGQPGHRPTATERPRHPGPRRLVPAGRHAHRAAERRRHRHRPARRTAPSPTRTATSSATAQNYKQGLVRPQRPDRRRRTCCRSPLTASGTPATTPTAPPTTRTRCCPTFRSHVHADRLAGRGHRLEVAQPVERLELEHRAVPRSAARS